MNWTVFSSEIITIPGLGSYPAFTALLLLYSAVFLMGLGSGYVFAFMRVLFVMPFKR